MNGKEIRKNNALDRKITFASVLRFTLPSIVMMVVMSLYTVVDGTFVSRLIGTDAFSAVNIVYPLMSVTIGLGTMFGTGLTAIVSFKLGEGRKREAGENFTFVLLFTVVLGTAVSILCYVFLEPLLTVLGAEGAVRDYGRDYALPLIPFVTANILQLQFQSLYVAAGKPQIGLVATVIGGLMNVALDYLFIARFHMGIAGAAVATGIGSLAPALFGLCYFAFGKKGELHFVKPRSDWRVLLHTTANGSSEMVNCLSNSVTTFLFNRIMMGLLGADGVASIGILLYLDFVLTAVVLGYSIGTAPLFGYHYGAGNHAKLGKLFSLSGWFCLLSGAAMTAGTIYFSEPLARIFTASGTEVYDLSVAGLKIYAFCFLAKGLNIFSSSMFTAYGNGRVSAVLSLLRTFVFLTLCLTALSAFFGVNGVWFATPVAEALSFAVTLFFVLRYRKTYHYLEKKA